MEVETKAATTKGSRLLVGTSTSKVAGTYTIKTSRTAILTNAIFVAYSMKVFSLTVTVLARMNNCKGVEDSVGVRRVLPYHATREKITTVLILCEKMKGIWSSGVMAPCKT